MSNKDEKRFYVYTLSYPESMGGHVFYVGKGQGSRITRHEADAINRSRVHTYNTPKSEIIRQIWRNGEQVKKQKVAFFDTGNEAFAYESNLIRSIGVENLVNIDVGQGGARLNTGPKRGKKPRVYLRLSDEDAKILWLLTKHRQASTGNAALTEEGIVGELVNRKRREIEQSYDVVAEVAQEPYIL